MSKKILKAVKIIAVAFTVLTVFHQMYKAFYSPFTTETVTEVDYYDGIDCPGLVIRDETVIHSSASGVISYPCKEGSKVAKNGVVANIFPTAEAADAYLKVQKLTDDINTLKDTQTYNDLYAADAGLLESKVFSALTELLNERQKTKKSINFTSDDELCNYMNRKSIITGAVTDFNMLISSLEQQKASYAALYNGKTGTVTTDRSGYFISVVDGYEGLFDLEKLDEITPESISSVKPVTPSADAVCKIVSDYKWHIAVTVPYDYSLSVKQGASMTLKTSIEGYTELPVTVECMNRGGKDKSVIVFTCKTVSEELAGLRTLPVTVVKDHYSGLKVDNRAIKFENGKSGVYVYRNNQLKFAEVETLYTGKYTIVKQETAKEDSLRLYDEIVVKGRNLYDGKLVE